MKNLKLVLGGPGCGKTTRLLSIMEEELAAGVPPSAIAFMAFTKAAAQEAIDRACKKFNLKPEDLPWFRTLHSAAYQTLGLSRDEVMDRRDWRTFSELVGEPVTGVIPEGEEQFATATKGDQMLRVVDYSATTLQDLEGVWRSLETPVSWFEMKRFADALSRYKNDTGKMDFTDMITVANAHSGPLDAQVAILDEAQDLTPAQWELARQLFTRAERVYVGGDDDQAIYWWAGADVEQFLNLESTEKEVLAISHRLPRSIHQLSQRIVSQIRHRYVKEFDHSGREGKVSRYRDLDHVDLGGGSWLLLARNGYMLKDLVQLAHRQGVTYRTRAGASVDIEHVRGIQLWEGIRKGKVTELDAPAIRLISKMCAIPTKNVREAAKFTVEQVRHKLPLDLIWHEAFKGINPGKREYYVSCLRRGEKLTHPPRVRIDTIHGVKGAEADNVLLVSDLSYKTMKAMERNPEHEHRVFYVGVTRAKDTLHILEPQSAQAYRV